MSNEELEFKNLTIKHFGFLVNEFGFVYDETKNQFDTRTIRISVEKYDRIVPSIIVWFKSEPKFTGILLDWLLEEFIDNKETNKLLIEGHLQYYANILKKHLVSLSRNSETMLLTAMKKQIINYLKFSNLTKYNFMAELGSFSKNYYYIKKKDMRWNPAKEL